MSLYVLDTNFFIQGWTYFNPDFCTGYWESISELGKRGVVVVPDMVYDELSKKEDDIFAWVKLNRHLVAPITEDIQNCVAQLMQHPKHRDLVNNSKGRSLGDPWVIAQAQSMNATVVTKESGKRGLKIPEVCSDLQLNCIDDFQFIRENKIQFTAGLAD